MKAGKFFGLASIAAGLLYFLVPVVFPVCGPAGDKVMRCFWSARAEMGVGAAVIAGGVFYLCSPDVQRRLGLSLMIGVLAVLGAALPLFLIGVCGNEAMRCRAGTLPAWMLVSGFLLLASLINDLLLVRKIKSGVREAAHV